MRYQQLVWVIFVFFLAFLNLAGRLAGFAASSSLMTDGLTIFVKQSNGSVTTKDCTDIWSCPVTLCEVRKKQNITSVNVLIYPPTSDRGDSCQAQGISWVWKFGYARAAVVFLVLSAFCQLLIPIVIRSNKIYAYVFTGSAYFSLLLAYLFEFLWTADYSAHRHDYQPDMIKGWNFTLSVFLLIGVGIADYFFLFQEQTYDELK